MVQPVIEQYFCLMYCSLLMIQSYILQSGVVHLVVAQPVAVHLVVVQFVVLQPIVV